METRTEITKHRANIVFRVIRFVIFSVTALLMTILTFAFPSEQYAYEYDGITIYQNSDREAITIFLVLFLVPLFTITAFEKNKKLKIAYAILTVLLFIYWFVKRIVL